MSDVKNPVVEHLDENEQMAQRRAKLKQLRTQGHAYPNNFKRHELLSELRAEFEHQTDEQLNSLHKSVTVAGRMMTRRVMGKASFANIQDMSGRMQLYIAKDILGDADYEQFQSYDLGDILGVQGFLFKTKTGELSIKVEKLKLLTKALRPMPDKFHGLQDHEQRFRQRYLDLLVNEDTRTIFQRRSQIVNCIRQFLDKRGYLEVETPMMHPLAGGAAARPFTTHHNALDMELFLRIAPELYLKRLVVGGFEKVYEINRNFRNEGVSTRHNPEFTMLEFYQAYATYPDLMDMTEELLRFISQQVLGTLKFNYQGTEMDLSKPFARLTLRESISHFNPEIKQAELETLESARALAKKHKINLTGKEGLGKIHTFLFEELVESRLQSPTFITQFPKEVSPLARANDENDFITDRFEFFVGGREVANGFSELNDPEDQAARFKAQVQEKAAGDAEAMEYDEDYITALEFGLPPTAGEGIGIDRLVMLFTDQASIREVILFPLLRNL